MKDGNQLTSKYSVKLQVMLRRLDTLAFASGSLEPARAKATIVNLAAICIDQAMVGKAEAALGSVSIGQVQLVWWGRGRLRRGWGGAAKEFGGSEVSVAGAIRQCVDLGVEVSSAGDTICNMNGTCKGCQVVLAQVGVHAIRIGNYY